MLDYDMECLCRKCKKPVKCGLFSLLRHGRPLCPACLVTQDTDDRSDDQQNKNFDHFKDSHFPDPPV